MHCSGLLGSIRHWSSCYSGQAFGFHTKITNHKIFVKYASVTNVVRVASWVPGVSLITGIFHLYKANQLESVGNDLDPQIERLTPGLKKRAIAEFCQASLFLAIFDIFITAVRWSE